MKKDEKEKAKKETMYLCSEKHRKGIELERSDFESQEVAER